MNKELLEKINETINKSLVNSSDDAQLQMKILKNNINAIFAEAEKANNPVATPAEQPVAPIAPAAPVQQSDPAAVETLEIQEEPDTLTSENMKSILIVDDSSMIRNYLERIFINDYNITMAVDGNDAIEKITQNQSKLNIILLDLVMPKADGFFVLEHIQKYNIDIPVIIISGDTSKESVEKAFDYGVVDMIKKPFDSDIIKEKITRYSK